MEEALDPALPICDAHHHLWSHRGTYLLPELLNDIASGHAVRSTVFVEAGAAYRTAGPAQLRCVGETEFADRIAEQCARVGNLPQVARGIVGYADLTLGTQVAEVVAAHIEASPARFRGVRHSATWDADPLARGSAPSPGLLREPGFQAGARELQALGLSFDAWLFHPQLADLLAFAKALPDLRIIVDHAAMPLGVGRYATQRDELFRAWRRALGELSKCPNVAVKLGGFGMPRLSLPWQAVSPEGPSSLEVARVIEPYCLTCIELFGVDRCMFESNFPPDKETLAYGVVWNAYKKVTRGFSDTDRKKLFHDNAVRHYRLS